MPGAFCDDSQPWVLARGNNTVVVTIAWTWDGVSTPPNCAGAVTSLRVQNVGTQTWKAMLPNARRGPAEQTIVPGADQTLAGNTLRQFGLETIPDILGVDLVEIDPNTGLPI